jgi:hypothetical protein
VGVGIHPDPLVRAPGKKLGHCKLTKFLRGLLDDQVINRDKARRRKVKLLCRQKDAVEAKTKLVL